MADSLENILMTSNKAGMIAYMAEHPEEVETAIRLALTDRKPHARRAATLVWSCIVEDDERVRPFVNEIIKALPSKSDDHQRELLKILLPMTLDDEQEGTLFNVAVSLWEQIGKNPSVRFTAFRMMAKIARNHPELASEMKLYTQPEYLETLWITAKKSILGMIKF
jgi:DNA-directed RNA polymerase subunit L